MLVLLELESFLRRYLPLVFWQVIFVTDQINLAVLGALGTDFFQPLGQLVEGATLTERVAKHNSVGASVENLSDGAERLLADCVPNLEAEDLLFDADHVCAEFDTNCDVVFFFKLVVSQTLQQAALSNC